MLVQDDRQPEEKSVFESHSFAAFGFFQAVYQGLVLLKVSSGL